MLIVVTRPSHLYGNYGDSPGSILWIWIEGVLEERPFGVDVYHYKIWGHEATQNFYRGRHDPSRRMTTVMPPVKDFGLVGDLPSLLQEKIEQRFPGTPVMVCCERD